MAAIPQQSVPEPQPQPEIVPAAPVEEVSASVEQSLQSIFATLNDEKKPESGDKAVEDPFQDSPVEAEPTRVMNLDDLQFGRNYNRE
jgi:hypothetical protein